MNKETEDKNSGFVTPEVTNEHTNDIGNDVPENETAVAAGEAAEVTAKRCPRFEDCLFFKMDGLWNMIPKTQVFAVNAIGSAHPGTFLTLSSVAYDQSSEENYNNEFSITSHDIKYYFEDDES